MLYYYVLGVVANGKERKNTVELLLIGLFTLDFSNSPSNPQKLAHDVEAVK